MSSLRRTLALRFGVTIFVALLAMGVSATLAVCYTLRHQLDVSLRATAGLQADILAAAGTVPSHQGQGDSASFAREVNRFVGVRDGRGRLVQWNAPWARDLPLDRAVFEGALAGRSGWSTQPWGSGRLRSIYLPLPGRPGAGALQVAASLGPLYAVMARVVLAALGLVLLATLTTTMGAGWLADSSLSAVAEVSRQARSISRLHGERITAQSGVTEFQELLDVLNGMLDRLEGATERLRRIIRGLGHDLRTPITVMRAGAEMALSGQRTPDQYRAVLGTMLEEIDRLTLISDSVVFLGRLESGDVRPALEPIDARVVAGDVVARVRERLGGHPLSISQGAEPLQILADRRLLAAAIDQLVDNALRHTPAQTPVRVIASGRNGSVLLEVEDEGPGVPDSGYGQIFEPFYRGDPARGRQAGAGLGLSVAAEIVRLHRGTIAAGRGASGGLRVRIEVPRVAIRGPTV